MNEENYNEISLDNETTNTEKNTEKNTERSDEEVLLACFGRNELGEANSEISATVLMYNGDESEEAKTNELNYTEIASRFTKHGEFYLEAHDGVVQVDIKFRSNMDPEMRLFWKALCDYGKRLNDYVLKNTAIPLMSMIVSPDEYSSEYYVSLSNPMLWFLQPESPENETCNIIRIFFDSSNVEINKVSADIDLTKAEAEASRIYNVIYTKN